MAMACLDTTKEFQAKAKSTLDSYSKLKDNVCKENVDSFREELTDLMRMKSNKKIKKELNEICMHLNFIGFDRKSLHALMKEFSSRFNYRGMGKICKRSKKRAFLTVLDDFKIKNKEIFICFSQERDGYI